MQFRMMAVGAIASVAVCLLLCPVSIAWAEDEQEHSTAKPSEPVPGVPVVAGHSNVAPPVLIELVTPTYPQEELESGRAARVVLQLTIDVEGWVTSSEIVESAGAGFDASAQEAASRMRFAPALRDGTPIAARFLCELRFAPPAASPPVEAVRPTPSAPLPTASQQSAAASPNTEPSKSVAPVEVTVAGQQSEAQKLQDSAEAVTVVSTAKARRRSADLGEVLARAQGIGIRRRGGLGSDATVSLNGLQDDQVRIFMDGVPLELAGYSFGLVNVPVNLVERVEIYRGVVPIRFGADALGGVINVVTDQRYETHAGASYQTGSWGTHRATLNGRYRHEPTGIVGGAAAFFDFARNDYWMHDRRLATPTGGTIVRSVRRFHDAYQAYGANVEVGVVEKKWANKLLLQAFYTHYRKELQHNANMTVPYGEIVYGGTTYGGTVRYEANLSPEVEVEALLNYTFRDIDFQDLGTHVYTWEGERGRPVGRGGAQGERLLGAFDLSDYEYGIYGRLGLQWELVPRHFLRTSATPYSIKRRGEGYVEQQINLTGLDEKLRQMVTGIEYEANLFGDRLSNVIFGKGYFFASSIEERTEGTGEIFTRRDNIHRFGGGDALRYRFTPWFLAKASYEYATRLPRPDELFGNGVLIDAPGKDNPITPEMSHNINLGPRFELEGTESGSYVADINGFARFSEDMIVLLLGTGAQSLPYANISDARTLGVEGAVSWSSPGKWLTLEGSLTYQDVRNTSTEGPFASQNGLRIPSRPYLFASWGSSLQFRRVLLRKDSVEPFYLGRYTHGFYRGWDLGDPTYKQSIASQVSHSLGLSWFYTDEFGQVTLTGEVENLTDAMLYDVFGEQRPGRAFYVKLTGQI